MKSVLALALTIAVTFPIGTAQAGRDIPSMRCADAQSTVARHGAIVLNTGPRTYRRFVSQLRYCDRWEHIRPAYAQAADTPQCQVGYICVDPPFYLNRR